LHELRDIHLIGDALYDHSKDFAHELVFKWGIHPVFPEHGAYATPEGELDNRLGVPICDGCGALMKFRDLAKFPTPYERRRLGLPRAGEYIRKPSGQIQDDAHIRWTCPHKSCGKSHST
jgi:hypothetical protein